jgi:hypothetical protein
MILCISIILISYRLEHHGHQVQLKQNRQISNWIHIEDQVIKAKAKRNKFKHYVPSNRVSELGFVKFIYFDH